MLSTLDKYVPQFLRIWPFGITPLKFSGEEMEAGIGGGNISFYAIVYTPSIDKMPKELSTKLSSNLLMSVNQ